MEIARGASHGNGLELRDGPKRWFSGRWLEGDEDTDLPELRLWLNQHGAPADAVVPAAFSKLPAFGCHVLTLGGQSVYLLCFTLNLENGNAATAMKKPAMLVHFVSVPLKAFKNPPVAGEPVIRTGEGEWKFAEWRSGDVVYVAGGELPLARLQEWVASL